MKLIPGSTRPFWTSLVGALSLSMVACTSNGASSSPSEPKLAGSAWTVQSVGGQAVNGGKPPSLTFSASMGVSGNGGCNNFSGQAKQNGMALSIGPIMATKMSCGPAQDKLESSFLGALRNAKHAEVKGDLLELKGEADAPVVVLVRVKQ